MDLARLRSPLAVRIAIGAVVFVVIAVIAVVIAGSGEETATTVTTQPPAPTTTSTAAPDPHITEVATANVPQLEVFAEKPLDPSDPATTPSTTAGGAQPASFTTGQVSAAAAEAAPIPRRGLNSAGSAKTDTGYTFDNPTYNKKPLVLVVTGREGEWLKVRLPVRPNGTEGWVRASDVTLSEHDFHGTLDLSDRKLTVSQGNTVIAETPVVVGKDETPTPLGELYINEVLTAAEAGVNPGGSYGPNLLPTNAYSEAMDLFDGGLPVIAFHGTNQPDLLGQAASNGCVRMPNEMVTQLAGTLPAGTPIDVVE